MKFKPQPHFHVSHVRSKVAAKQGDKRRKCKNGSKRGRMTAEDSEVKRGGTQRIKQGHHQRAMSQEAGQERTMADTSVWAQPAV